MIFGGSVVHDVQFLYASCSYGRKGYFNLLTVLRREECSIFLADSIIDKSFT